MMSHIYRSLSGTFYPVCYNSLDEWPGLITIYIKNFCRITKRHVSPFPQVKNQRLRLNPSIGFSLALMDSAILFR